MKLIQALAFVLALSCVITSPLLAASSEDLAIGLSILGLVVIVAAIVITILFLIAQSSLVDTMRTSNPDLNTSKAWIWTQLIPIWALVAIPVTLVKINSQFQAFVQEHNYTPEDIKFYSSLWGWIWYGANIVSIFIPIVGVVSLIGIIGFWVHINGVRKSILAIQAQ